MWSLGGLGIKLADASPMAIAGYRSLFALPVLLFAMGPGVWGHAGALLRRPPVWMAAFAYAWTVTLFVLANRLTLSANAILLQYTGPLWVVVLSGPLLGEKVRGRDIVAVLVGLFGLVLVSIEGLVAGRWLGDLLAVLSGVGFGGIPLLLRLEQHGAGPEPEAGASRTTAPAEVVGTTGGKAGAIQVDRPHTKLAPAFSFALGSVMTVVVCAPWMVTQGPADGRSWAVVAGLGVVQIGAAYSLFGAGTRDLRAVEASLVTMVEPVLNPIWVALVTYEIPGPGALAGGLAILVAVLIQLLG